MYIIHVKIPPGLAVQVYIIVSFIQYSIIKSSKSAQLAVPIVSPSVMTVGPADTSVQYTVCFFHLPSIVSRGMCIKVRV